MSERTNGECTFERYMMSQGLAEFNFHVGIEQGGFFDILNLAEKQFVFEPKLESKNKPPDYLVKIDREYLFEVKEFYPSLKQADLGFAPKVSDDDDLDLGECFAVDQYKPIKNRIDAARKKFKEYEGWPCCLVLYKNSPIEVE